MGGVRAVEDPDLLREVAARGVCFDVCLTSNVKLGVVPTLEQHPLPVLLATGVACSLGADDPLLFGASLLGEYDHARTTQTPRPDSTRLTTATWEQPRKARREAAEPAGPA